MKIGNPSILQARAPKRIKTQSIRQVFGKQKRATSKKPDHVGLFYPGSWRYLVHRRTFGPFCKEFSMAGAGRDLSPCFLFRVFGCPPCLASRIQSATQSDSQSFTAAYILTSFACTMKRAN